MQRHRSPGVLLNLEASLAEIATDFKGMGCGTEKQEFFSPEIQSKKKRPTKTDQVALSGVLGLASLISNHDLQAEKVPNDWFQQYPLTGQVSSDILPTGIALKGKELLSDSYNIYYRDQQENMSQHKHKAF